MFGWYGGKVEDLEVLINKLLSIKNMNENQATTESSAHSISLYSFIPFRLKQKPIYLKPSARPVCMLCVLYMNARSLSLSHIYIYS